MNTQILAFVGLLALSALAGWLARGLFGARWRKVKDQHRFGDPKHLWVEINGEMHAFTDDQLLVARMRAGRFCR